MPESEYGPYVYVPNSSGGQSRVCPEMVQAIKVAYWLAGLLDKLVYTQGGLNDSAVAASKKVHNGLCVADLRSTNMTDAELWSVATWLLRCGVIANIRGVVDSMVDHMHCVMANPVHAHQDAKDQVAEYRAGGDGLIGSRPFYGPKVPFTTWEDSPYYGLDELDMATPGDVWRTDVAPGTETQSAGKVLWAVLGYVKNLPAKILATKAGTGKLNGWTVAHLIDWNARATQAQGEILSQIVTMLGQISQGQEVAQADLDAVQAQVADLVKPEEPDEPETPEDPEVPSS